MNKKHLPPYPWQKNCSGHGGPRIEPLIIDGPGPKDIHKQHDPHMHDHHKPAPPFMDDCHHHGPAPHFMDEHHHIHHDKHDPHMHDDHHKPAPPFMDEHHDHHDRHEHHFDHHVHNHHCPPPVFIDDPNEPGPPIKHKHHIPAPPFMHDKCNKIEPTHMPRPVALDIPQGPKPPKPHHMNCHQHRQKYFYTVLFLDNYYENKTPIQHHRERPNGGALKTFDICEDTNTANVRWLDDRRLYVRHNLPLPITLEMWDHENRPIVYCPILKRDIDNVALGDVQVDSDRSIIINFCATQKPIYNQVFKLAIRNLPDFSLTPNDHESPSDKSLKDLVGMPKPQRGLALIFRRNTLDGLYDLISEFDQTYYHSLDESSDIKYLTEKSCYKEVCFTTKYTNNLQDVMDLIDVNYYNVQYSWENHKKYLD